MILLVGDSLSVGAEPYTPPAWHVRARVGRNSLQGRRIIARRHPQTLVWALGTNDTSRAMRYRGLEAAIHHGRRVVAVTIRGVSGAVAFNRRIYRRLPAACVVPWRRWANGHRRQLAGDGIHGTPAAYRARARMTRRAVRRCP